MTESKPIRHDAARKGEDLPSHRATADRAASGTVLKRGGVFLLGAIVASVAFLDFCDLVYRCGCRAVWAGAAEACNIHDPIGPHCPWCSYGLLGAAVPFGAILLAQGAVAFWPGKGSWRLRLLGVLVALPVVGGLAALAFGLYSGYWGS